MGYSLPTWWQLLSQLVEADLDRMDLRCRLRLALEGLTQDPVWAQSGLSNRLCKALAMAEDASLPGLVIELTSLASAGFSAKAKSRSTLTRSSSGSDEECANSPITPPPFFNTTITSSSGATSTQSADTTCAEHEFAVPRPRSPRHHKNVVWNTAVRLEVQNTSVSLCNVRMVVPSFCCDSGLPTRLMFDSLVKRRGVTLGRNQACHTAITSATAAQQQRLRTLAQQELVAVCNLGTHALIFVPYEKGAHKQLCAVSFLVGNP